MGRVVKSSKVIAACVAFGVTATITHAAGGKPFTMTKEECRKKILKWRNKAGPGKRAASTFRGVHDFDTSKPRFVGACIDRYGRQ